MDSTLETRAHAQAAIDYLTEHPEKHQQTSWFNTHNGSDVLFANEEDINLCQTTMCAAGTVQFLHRGYVDVDGAYGVPVDIDAAQLLGLDEDEAYYLFHYSVNDQAIDALTAIAQGDGHKFWGVFGYPAIA